MRRRDIAELVVLAALWGGSFLFMRIAAPAFGASALAFVRVAGACIVLLPLLSWQGQAASLRRHWRPIGLVGVTNSALPFLGFAFAALAISGGLASIFNAAAPLWAALIAWAWLGERPAGWRALGLALGFGGVALLVFGKASLLPGAHGVSPSAAIAACLAGALLYGFSANFAKRRLQGVPPLAVAAGSQVSAALALAPAAIVAWPRSAPDAGAWAAAAILAAACTGAAYVMYFRLIAHVGPGNAITVTFLVPAFAMLWGGVFLGEAVTLPMLGGAAVIVLGTALATGFWQPRARRVA